MADLVVAGRRPFGLPRLTGLRAGSWEMWIPGAVLAVVVGACFLGPGIAHLPGPNVTDLLHPRAGLLTRGHPLGTDDLGRDLLSRALYGGRTSLEVGTGSVVIGLVVGGILGMVSGFRGGILDTVIMRVLDVLLAFPSLVLALTVASYLGPSQRNVTFAIAFFTVPSFARIARAGTLQIRGRDYILAGTQAGARAPYQIARHVLPNIMGRLLTYGLLTVGVAMIVEASLSFLGLGVRPPTASWGAMIAEGKAYLTNAPQIAMVPSVFLLVSVASLNMLGDATRSRFEGLGES